jgi:hypothetical protein
MHQWRPYLAPSYTSVRPPYISRIESPSCTIYSERSSSQGAVISPHNVVISGCTDAKQRQLGEEHHQHHVPCGRLMPHARTSPGMTEHFPRMRACLFLTWGLQVRVCHVTLSMRHTDMSAIPSNMCGGRGLACRMALKLRAERARKTGTSCMHRFGSSNPQRVFHRAPWPTRHATAKSLYQLTYKCFSRPDSQLCMTNVQSHALGLGTWRPVYPILKDNDWLVAAGRRSPTRCFPADDSREL